MFLKPQWELNIMKQQVELSSGLKVPSLVPGYGGDRIPLPDFDAHAIEESLLVNHRIFDGSQISRDELPKMIADYREFWREHKEAGAPALFTVPNRTIDRVWHTHMCETEKYGRDCVEYFGNMFHHSSKICDGGLSE